MIKKKATLWITDPWTTLDHPKDTSLRLAEEGLILRIPQYWCDVRSIRLEGSDTKMDVREILEVSPARKAESFSLGHTRTCEVSEFKQIHFRTDPPVDFGYLHPLQILGIGLRKSPKTELVNPLEVLLQGNEKLEGAALKSTGLFPPSVVSSQWEVLKKFGIENGRTVLKPLHEAQSHGVELLDWAGKTPTGRRPGKRESAELNDSVRNAKTVLQSATHGFYQPVLLQKYLKGISLGETRLWFLDGVLLAAVKKLPLTGDFRVNIDQGSQLQPAKLSATEKTACKKIATHLKAKMIRLAAVDLIEGWITDFNFTSPGLITQMEALLGNNFARTIVKTLSRA